VVEELIDARGHHPSLDMDGTFLGRDIVLLDMSTGKEIFKVHVPLKTCDYSYALSGDGKEFAMLVDSKLTIYSVP
jgi:hypothetical protein